MKKLIVLPLLFFVFACNNKPVNNNGLGKSTAVSSKYPADSMTKWTKNILPNYIQTVKGDYKDNKLSQGDGC